MYGCSGTGGPAKNSDRLKERIFPMYIQIMNNLGFFRQKQIISVIHIAILWFKSVEKQQVE